MTPASAPRDWREWRRIQKATLLQHGIVVAIVLLLLAFLILCVLIRQPFLLTFDEGVTRAIQRYRSYPLDTLALWLTFLGNGKTVAVLGVLVGLTLFVKRGWRTALLCLAAMLGHPITPGIKALFGRQRPGGDIVQVILPGIGLSFPSGHALSSALFYGFLALLCAVYISHIGLRRAAILLLILLIVGIGLSRIYLGAHWLSDVVGGWIVGLFLLLLLAEGYKAIEKDHRADSSKLTRE